MNILYSPGPFIFMSDGITHINVYSQGQTELGSQLSNFAHTPFRIPFLGKFESVEGFWYWYLTEDNRLRTCIGFHAKQLGKKIGNFKQPEKHFPKRLLKIAYRAKLRYNPKIEEMLLKNTLPLKHYYIYNGKIVEPKQFQWTATLWEEIKKERQ